MTRRTVAIALSALLMFVSCASGTESAGISSSTTASATTDPPADTTAAEPDSQTETTTSSSDITSSSDMVADDEFPSVIDAVATAETDGAWQFDVTISSPYDSPSRYADAWRVLGPDGSEFGIRVLTHDHASEQPFTRSQSGIQIPSDVQTVTIEGRDLVNGWGGPTFVVDLPAAGS